MHRALISILTLSLILAGACKKKPPPAPLKPVTISPRAAPPAPRADDDDDDDDDGDPRGDDDNWRHTEPAAAKKAAPKAPRARKQTDARAPLTPAQIAAAKENRAQIATSAAVNRSLDAAGPRLKSCFDRFAKKAGAARLRLRVSPTGYIVKSDISGVSTEVTSCLDSVIRGIKVDGVETDSLTIDRTLTFTVD